MWQKALDLVDLQGLLNEAIRYLPNVIAAFVVLVVFWVGMVVLTRLLAVQLRRTDLPGATRDLLLKLLKYTIVVIALLAAAQQFDIKITSILAGLGVAGLAASLAAQETIANTIAGITLVLDKPFQVGDWVEIAGIHAHVESIRLRTTTLTTFDNQTIVIPNKLISQERIINYTLVPRIRVRVPIGIAYKEDIRQARQVLLATLTGDDDILAEPQPKVLVTGLGASSVNVELRFWIQNPPLQLSKQWEYTEKCKYALDEAGIEIPFPHLQLFLEQSRGLADLTDSVART